MCFAHVYASRCTLALLGAGIMPYAIIPHLFVFFQYNTLSIFILEESSYETEMYQSFPARRNACRHIDRLRRWGNIRRCPKSRKKSSLKRGCALHLLCAHVCCHRRRLFCRRRHCPSAQYWLWSNTKMTM